MRVDGVAQLATREFVTAAFAMGRKQIVGVAVTVEQIDILDVASVGAVCLVDVVAAAVRVGSDRGFVYGAGSGVENRRDMVASTAAHPHERVVVAVGSEIVEGPAGGELPFGWAEFGWIEHRYSRR
ncbi:hypothetical protein GL305_19275 [Nocardia seriolae]|nr:hypothetical protein [Nocardia seriolae]MTJ88054.1 hypothetical protein [Nocardia seriolae]MTK32044.1 hypothetical protein [Nocardia seriolae]MTK48624.1 hypothetical protein [Nocardia seriolae]MTL13620.1 hypothetical protein [Nocardia seriolae]